MTIRPSSPLLLAALSSLYAQQPLAQADASVFQLDKVVVNATRSERSLDETAASVAVVNAEQLESRIAKEIKEAFDYMPGVNVDTDARYGLQDVNIRGLEGNRIKILVDGVEQPKRFDSGAEFMKSGRLDIDPDMIKAVEVIKGPASSLQGSDAIGGVVAFQTKDAADYLETQGNDTGGQIKLGYFSVDKSFKQTLAIANRTGQLETLLIGTHRSGEEEDNFGTPYPQDNTGKNLLGKVHYTVNAQHRLGLTGEWVETNTDTELPLIGYGRSGPVTYDYFYGEDSRSRRRLGFEHNWRQQAPAFDQLTWSVNWQQKEENDKTHRRQNGRLGEIKNYSYEEEGYQFDVQLNKNFTVASSAHSLIYGATYYDKEISNVNQTTYADGSSIFYHYMPEAAETRWGIFIQDEISLLDDTLLITPGVRYDKFQTQPDLQLPSNSYGYEPTTFSDYEDSAVTARLGAVYSLNETHKVFAQYSQGFRAPDFKELYYSFSNSNHFYQSRPNPDLEAEKSDAFELGLRSNFKAGSTEIAVFYTDYDDFIERYDFIDPNTFFLVYTYDNIEQATIKGIEFSANLWLDQLVSAPEGSSLRLAAAYADGEDKEGQPLNSVAPWDVVVGIAYDDPNGFWGSELKAVYSAKKGDSDINFDATPNQITLDSSTVVDLTAYVKPLENLTVRAGVFNLTDEEYLRWNDARGLTPSSRRPVEDYSQPGRNYSISVNYDF